MSEQQVYRRYFVSGRVQGVFYRASTQQQAQALGVAGWVRNRHDGRVEVYACGTYEQLQALKNWLEIGPEHAKVSNIDIFEANFEPCNGFAVLPTQ